MILGVPGSTAPGKSAHRPPCCTHGVSGNPGGRIAPCRLARLAHTGWLRCSGRSQASAAGGGVSHRRIRSAPITVHLSRCSDPILYHTREPRACPGGRSSPLEPVFVVVLFPDLRTMGRAGGRNGTRRVLTADYHGRRPRMPDHRLCPMLGRVETPSDLRPHSDTRPPAGFLAGRLVGSRGTRRIHEAPVHGPLTFAKRVGLFLPSVSRSCPLLPGN